MSDQSILGNDKVTVTSLLKLLPIAVLSVTVIASFAVAKSRIDENKEDIKQLKKGKEQMIRMEERQKYIQSDVKAIKKMMERGAK